MDWIFDNLGRLIVWLQKPGNQCEPFAVNEPMALRDTLRAGDVLLVEGKGRISGSIKYLTQSTWSHSALYVGPVAGAATNGEPHVLIEANIEQGVVSAPLSKYLHCRTRICRPVGLSEADCERVCRYASERIGLGYDFRNVVDLMRYLFPWAMTPRWRHRSIALECQPYHLLFAHCASVRRRALPDPAQDNAGRQPDRAPGSRRDPSLVALCAA
jgi:Permuted papain-like amidase enzyme, YaeF/YiiX, C92 family